VLVTYHMNRLQGFASGPDFFVTLNGADRIAPASALARCVYHHPVFDAEALAAQKLHAEIDGSGGVHFAGAYWCHGFHEDGLRSAEAVVERIERT
jgi:predicted NAD/FAD-binding protein